MILSRAKQKKNLEDWHDWFAWYPVFAFNENNVECLIWLEFARRRIIRLNGEDWAQYSFTELNT